MGCCQTDDGRYDYKSNRASDLLAGPIFLGPLSDEEGGKGPFATQGKPGLPITCLRNWARHRLRGLPSR